MKKIIFVALSIFFPVVITYGAVYKWIDEEGNVHYSENPPRHTKSREIHIKPTRPQPISKDPLKENNKLQTRFEGQSATLEDLGPLPGNVSSKYLTTKSSGIAIFDWKNGIAKYNILLIAKPDLPFKAYLEAHFENPMYPGTPLIVGESRQTGQQEIFFMSPEFKGLKCWNYLAKIYVYKDSTMSELLDIHQQIIQSRVNIDKVMSKSLMDVLKAIRHGNCP